MPSTVIAVHLAGALTALALGTAILLRTKGTAMHKLLGRAWVALMTAVAVSSFWIFNVERGTFSWIHLLSVWTLISLTLAIIAIRRGRVRAHRAFMIGTFLGLAGAGIGALSPDRLLGRFVLG